MTDIVERLRNRAAGYDDRAGALELEAADEIERLQGCQEGDAESIKFLADEIERLRSALEMIIDDTYDEAAKTIARRTLEPKP